MESLCYAFEGGNFSFTDHTDFQLENITISKNSMQNPVGKSLHVPTSTLANNGTHFFDHSLTDHQSSGSSYIDTSSRCNNLNRTLEAPSPAKRAKLANVRLSAPTCQVLGCNKDLSLSKDYHKRHKVCDVHSKTAVVVVNGKQQRFCQQCSRFHVVAEFDEGKRSCRKRLAGHNERRRKPQLQCYFGSSYLPTNASRPSSTLPGGFSGGFYYPQCNNNKPIGHNNPLEIKHNFPFPISPSHPVPISHFAKKVSPTKHGLDNTTPLPIQESSVGSTNSGCALSLLSSQSHHLLHNVLSENFNPPNFAPGWGQNEARTSSLFPEGSETVSLVELSLYLQRVEQQKVYEKAHLL